MGRAPMAGRRVPLALTLAFVLVVAASGAAGETSSTTVRLSPSDLNSTLVISASTTTNTTSYSSLQTGSNSSSSQVPIGAGTLLYYFIPELTVLAFFAVGLYLILGRGGGSGRRRRPK